MQYTIRNIPKELDAALRRRAREAGTSLNQAAVEAMARGAGLPGAATPRRTLRDLAGRWRDDPDFDRAIADQDKVDAELWR
jgi:plasmid stability protein